MTVTSPCSPAKFYCSKNLLRIPDISPSPWARFGTSKHVIVQREITGTRDNSLYDLPLASLAAEIRLIHRQTQISLVGTDFSARTRRTVLPGASRTDHDLIAPRAACTGRFPFQSPIPHCKPAYACVYFSNGTRLINKFDHGLRKAIFRRLYYPWFDETIFSDVLFPPRA